MICHFCKKKIRDNTAYWLYGEPYHLDCFTKQVRLERKNLAKEKEQQEQSKLERWAWFQ